MGVDISKIITSSPIDRTTARAMSGGESYETPESAFADYVHSDTPLPIAPVPSNAANIVGRRFGTMIVVGYAATQNPNKNATWVVRCNCGAFEHRKARATNNPHDCCRVCTHRKQLAIRYESTKRKREKQWKRCAECGLAMADGHTEDCSAAECRQKVVQATGGDTWCKAKPDAPIHPSDAHEYEAVIQPTTPHRFRYRTHPAT